MEALEAARAGDVIVTSGTASGKSLSFNLPVLDSLVADPKSRALYVYPTKALAQDQARKLAELGLPELRHAIYDGDTPQATTARRSAGARTSCSPTRTCSTWRCSATTRAGATSSPTCSWVVIDEAHTYRGVFGSHVANVLRRLRRVARVYGAEPRFICASATIANPVELAAGAGRAPTSRSSTPTGRRGPSAGSRSGTRP